MALTEEAREEIKKAIRIVREDRFEQYARTTIGKHTALPPKEEKPPTDSGLEKPEDEKAPPPEKEKEKEIEEKATKRVDAWWGEIED